MAVVVVGLAERFDDVHVPHELARVKLAALRHLAQLVEQGHLDSRGVLSGVPQVEPLRLQPPEDGLAVERNDCDERRVRLRVAPDLVHLQGAETRLKRRRRAPRLLSANVD